MPTLLDGTAIARALRPDGMRRAMAPLVPLLLVSRPLGRLARRGERPHKEAELGLVPGFNGAMRALRKLERLAQRYAELPFGSSLPAVARRPGARR